MSHWIPAAALALALPACGLANVETSPRPTVRPATFVQPQSGDFDAWRAGFAARARAGGISQATLDRTLPLMRRLPETVALDRRQSEFGARIWDYMDSTVSANRISQGQSALRRHADVLNRIEARYGVPPEVLVAIWGIESSYGANRGGTAILATLATLAKDGRRGEFFESQLMDALRIVQAGDISPQAMIGSWAGAFGHMQFMPSSFLTYAVDFTGNGRRDVWADDPTDALASAANYLARRGWTRGQPWAREVILPGGFDLRLTGQTRSAADWTRAGVQVAAGAPLQSGQARLVLPGGARGPAFLTYGNYDVLKEYNISDAYVLAVGHLSDRLRGGPGLQGNWPRNDRALTLDERRALQRRLNALGHDTGGVDGRIGPATVAAVQAWQKSQGLAPDGYVNADLLRQLLP
ncbi:lytic murein transglycosylase [Roseinatronobacter alkalisoli]|uniref:Lytic murein transglycosylase n=1 Tax=Roseinatronobacter alkalisoli TaxID=3028235 RepID=A0ABT5TBX2_9RHOB|nr:lytic murein transglycosylase [Roseinatronobacter sp. HJB301]MDD7972629.1 lytic murein transglycosylase [Roseinatronobacter sp. HJB301]